MSLCRDAALIYAARGWAIFPCQGKIPLTRRGFKDATLDSTTINTLFAQPCNIAIRTGGGLGVLDLDVREGKNGNDTLAAWEAQHGKLPKTYSVTTWSGGQHYYFTCPDLPSKTALGEGVDFKCRGGYVIAPPSEIDGKAYVLDEDAPLADLPPWLIDKIKGVKPKLLLDAKGQIPPGTQDDQLHKLACSLTKQGLSPDVIRAGLKTALLAAPQDPAHPFTDADVERWMTGAKKLIGDDVAAWLPQDITLTEKGKPVCNADAALRVLEQHPVFKDALWFDTFQHRLMTTWQSPETREWQDEDTQRLLIFMQRDVHLSRLSKSAVEDALSVYATRTKRHLIREWCQTLTWDHTPRIDTCFSTYFGSPDTPYVRAASRNFWLALVARIYRPGCQADHMVVLEGRQGIGKTSALRIIGGAWYLSLHVAVGSLDFYQLLPGKLVVEIAELDAFRKSDVTRIKQAISTTVDSYRKSYGRIVQDYPRQCLFVGSTNEDHYLHDPTGGRRFWPVPCGAFDLIELRAQRDQLFAEALVRFKKGETWHQMPDETSEEQEARRQADSWEDPVREFLLMKEETTLREVLCDGLQFQLSRITRSDEWRVAHILKSLGWTVHIRKDANQKSLRRWCAPQREPGEDVITTGDFGSVEA